jgi:hypothetical protein
MLRSGVRAGWPELSVSAKPACDGLAQPWKPYRLESFKISNDPEFAEELEDVIGRYLNPPEHALGLCMEEKSQIRALDPT